MVNESEDEKSRLLNSSVNDPYRTPTDEVFQSYLERGVKNGDFNRFCPSFIPMRGVIAVLVFFGLMIVYALRINLSVAILTMSNEYLWSDTTKGLVLSSFFCGYIVMQVPGGWLSGKFGGKHVFSAALLGASIFSILLPATANVFPLLIMCRVITGLFEAVSYPTVHSIISRWIPENERSTYVTFMWSGSFVGTIFSLLATPPIMNSLGWRSVFYIFGSIGIFWWIFWQLIASSSPEESVWISAEEIYYIQKTRGPVKHVTDVPWKTIFTSVPVWALIFNHFCVNWGGYIFLTWLPTYLKDELDFSLDNSSFISVLPYIISFFISIITGRVVDKLITSGFDRTIVRKVVQSMGLLIPSVFLILLCQKQRSVTLAVFYVVSAIATGAFATSGYGPNALDIGPNYAGILFGLSNTAATIPGIAGVYLTGYIRDVTHSWSLVFWITTGINVAGTIVWILFASGKLSLHK